MLGLAKVRAEPGLALDDVPEPEIGINDVLIRVLKTGICGTDLHIYNWDEWAPETIPVPMVVGHEFVGEVVESAPTWPTSSAGEIVSGEGPRRLRPLPQLPRRPPPPVRAHDGHRRQPARRVRRVHRAADDQRLAPLARASIRDVAAIFDPFGNAVHTALSFHVLGEDVLITGAGPIGCMAAAVVRHAGARHVVDHRREPVPAGARRARWA